MCAACWAGQGSKQLPGRTARRRCTRESIGSGGDSTEAVVGCL